MAIRKYKPTTPGRRGSSVADFAEITRSTPEKSLLRPLPKTGGRNNAGRITTRHIGGGHKRQYRVIDFRRSDKDGVDAKVAPGQVGCSCDCAEAENEAVGNRGDEQILRRPAIPRAAEAFRRCRYQGRKPLGLKEYVAFQFGASGDAIMVREGMHRVCAQLQPPQQSPGLIGSAR